MTRASSHMPQQYPGRALLILHNGRVLFSRCILVLNVFPYRPYHPSSTRPSSLRSPHPPFPWMDSDLLGRIPLSGEEGPRGSKAKKGNAKHTKTKIVDIDNEEPQVVDAWAAIRYVYIYLHACMHACIAIPGIHASVSRALSFSPTPSTYTSMHLPAWMHIRNNTAAGRERTSTALTSTKFCLASPRKSPRPRF